MPPAPKAPVAKKMKATGPVDTVRWPFGRRNYVVFCLAMIIIISGYVSLAQGSITLAPLLLVIGYCVLIPLAILIKDPTVEAKHQAADGDE